MKTFEEWLNDEFEYVNPNKNNEARKLMEKAFLAGIAEAAPKPCKWVNGQFDISPFKTDCGQRPYNLSKYCPFCGGLVTAA